MEGGRLKDKRVARGRTVQRGYSRRSPASLNSGFLHLCQAEPFQLQTGLKTLPSGLGWSGEWFPVCPVQGLKDLGASNPTPSPLSALEAHCQKELPVQGQMGLQEAILFPGSLLCCITLIESVRHRASSNHPLRPFSSLLSSASPISCPS